MKRQCQVLAIADDVDIMSKRYFKADVEVIGLKVNEAETKPMVMKKKLEKLK